MSPHPTASSLPGTLHFIPPNLSAFEPSKQLAQTERVNTLLWIGGLSDTLLSVSYPQQLAQALGPTWSLVMGCLTSSGLSWGVGSISRDAEDMAKIVNYLKSVRPGGNVVIMGHSTGCQDGVEYVIGTNANKRPPVDGLILQAPVSDREALSEHLPGPHLHEANQLALAMSRDGKQQDVLPQRLTRPMFGRVAITAQRWLDLASPGPDHTGADDFFSSDLPDGRLDDLFGKMPATTPLPILYSGSDEYVSSSLDKKALVQRWIAAIRRGSGVIDEVNSGIVRDATHNYNGCPQPVVQDLLHRVTNYIQYIDNAESKI